MEMKGSIPVLTGPEGAPRPPAVMPTAPELSPPSGRTADVSQYVSRFAGTRHRHPAPTRLRLPGRNRTPRRVAMLSVHTSPLHQPGTGDAGGMNVYIVELAKRLAEIGRAHV